MQRWVLDTSPLLFLAKIDRLEVLRPRSGELIVPPAVWDEIQVRDDNATKLVRAGLDDAWLKLRAPMPERLNDLPFQLGLGETQVLALGHELEADRVVMDDLRARRAARQLGLLPVGTLGVLLGSRLRGEIPSLREEVLRLQNAGFRASEPLIGAILRSAGELEEPG